MPGVPGTIVPSPKFHMNGPPPVAVPVNVNWVQLFLTVLIAGFLISGQHTFSTLKATLFKQVPY